MSLIKVGADETVHGAWPRY